VGFRVSALAVLEPLGLETFEQFLGRVFGDDASRGRDPGVGISQDLLLTLPEPVGARGERAQPFGDGRRPRHSVVDQRLDHDVEAFSLVESAGFLGVDASGGAIDGKLVALIEVEDRGIADRPDVLDAVDSGFGIADNVPGVAGHAHAELVRLVGDHREHGPREAFAHPDPVVAVLLLLLHDRARRFRVRDLDVAAPGARAFGLELAFARADRLAGRPEARAADAAHLGALFLGEAPGAVLLG